MWELDCEESWALKNWCFWTMVLEKTLASALDSKEIKPVDPKGNKQWIFIGGLMLKLKLQLEKTLMLGKMKDWEQKKKATEDEMIGWHHQLNGHEFEQTPGDSGGQESLVCCSPWGCKELEMTCRLNSNNRDKIKVTVSPIAYPILFSTYFHISNSS